MRITVNNTFFDDEHHSLWPALKSAQAIMNQSMTPEFPNIYASFFEQHRKTSAELMRKMLPAINPGTLGVGRIEQFQTVAGIGGDYWAGIRERIDSSVSLSSTVQSLLDIGVASTVNSQSVGMLDMINRQYTKDLLPSLNHVVQTNTAPPGIRAMAYDALSGVNRNIRIGSAAYALDRLPGRSLSPLLARVSSSVKTSAIAKDFSETIASQFEFPDGIFQKLVRALDFYKPKDLPMAMKVAIADTEIAEAVEELIDEHLEEVQEFASKVYRDATKKWFPNAPSEYAGVISIGAHGIFNISLATFGDFSGEMLVYAVLGTILLVVLDAGGTILKDFENFRGKW